MDSHKVRKLNPKRPNLEQLDPAGISLYYDDALDTLFLYLTGDEIAPVSVLVDPEDDVYALVDPMTEEVVGLRMETFLEEMVFKNPVLIVLGLHAGIKASKFIPVIERLEEVLNVEPVDEAKRRNFGESIIDFLQRLFGPPDGSRAMASA